MWHVILLLKIARAPERPEEPRKENGPGNSATMLLKRKEFNKK
jgi:hypothetical protein